MPTAGFSNDHCLNRSLASKHREFRPEKGGVLLLATGHPKTGAPFWGRKQGRPSLVVRVTESGAGLVGLSPRPAVCRLLRHLGDQPAARTLIWGSERCATGCGSLGFPGCFEGKPKECPQVELC